MSEILLRVMRALQDCDGFGDLFYRFDRDGSLAVVGVQCSDFFWWGTADMEKVTPANVHVLEEAVRDCKAVGDDLWAPQLFCARVRGMRPQGAAYPPEPVRFLFDACGPEREVELTNPRPAPAGGDRRLTQPDR